MAGLEGVVLVVIFCLLFISGFAGLLPVFSCVLVDKSLIINGIHFSGWHAFYRVGGVVTVTDIFSFMGWYLGFISCLLFISGLPVCCRCFHAFW